MNIPPVHASTEVRYDYDSSSSIDYKIKLKMHTQEIEDMHL